MELQVGVKAALRDAQGRILLVRRSPLKYPEVGPKWDIVGGRINPGTPLLENLAREIREETGLAIQGEPTLIAAQDILRVPGRHVVRLTYTARAEGAVRLNEEHDEFAWFTLDEIRALEALDIYFKALVDAGLI